MTDLTSLFESSDIDEQLSVSPLNDTHNRLAFVMHVLEIGQRISTKIPKLLPKLEFEWQSNNTCAN